MAEGLVLLPHCKTVLRSSQVEISYLWENTEDSEQNITYFQVQQSFKTFFLRILPHEHNVHVEQGHSEQSYPTILCLLLHICYLGVHISS